MVNRRNKYFFITALFLIIIIVYRIIWFHLYMYPPHTHAENGVLDLRQWNFTDDLPLTLDGEWEFYPEELLKPDRFVKPERPLPPKRMLSVPGNWRDAFGHDEVKSAYRFGTFRLRILLPETHSQLYGISVQSIASASKLYINGQFVAGSGEPAAVPEEYIAKLIPYSAHFHPEQNQLDIVIQVANFDSALNGGITKSLLFGTEKAISHQTNFTQLMQVIASVILLLHCLYAVIIYLIGDSKRELLYFALLLFCSSGTFLFEGDKLLLNWLPLSYLLSFKLLLLSYVGLSFTTLQFFKLVLPKFGGYRVHRGLVVFSGMMVPIILIVPLPYVSYFSIVVILQCIATFSFILFQVIQDVWDEKKDSIFLLLAIISILSSLIWGIINDIWLPTYIFYPFDGIIAIICFACYLFRQYIHLTVQSREQAEQLQKVDKLKDEFLANTSHELRNPLHGMINIAQTVLDDESNALNDQNKQSLELLITIGRRLSYTLNDLLDITRLKEQHIRLQIKSISMHTVASGVVDMLQFMTKEKDIQLTLEIPHNFPKVLADENRLIQILFNLILNAIKFTDTGGVTISSASQGDKAIIYVKDTGIGMDEETQQRIFLPYEQGNSDNDGHPLVGGIGIGLSITKQLVELHGGTLRVKSAVGEGSVFSFSLPVTGIVEELQDVAEGEISRETLVDSRTSETNGIPPSSANLTLPRGDVPRSQILIVDDDPINLKIMEMMLTPAFDCVTVTSGKKALAELASGDWELVISDVMMPYMSGYELTKQIRKQYSISEMPILLLTARSQTEDIYTGFLSGANDYLIKPVEALELKARVYALTSVKRSISERLRMEAAWLQAQIQPHFLFNTLNTIASLSEVDPQRMLRLIEHFGNYLKRSFDVRNSESVVPIEHELDLLRSYLYIEKERFGTRLEVDWQIDERFSLKIPPLSIQPIVENAVRHGILRKASGGVVTIRISDSRLWTEISIHDNGVGMTPEKLEQILTSQPDKSRGIGLLNTDRRLKQLYGQGLRIESQPGFGTTVSFRVPKE